MFEIKLKKKKSIWPYMFIGLFILLFIAYYWNQNKKGERPEKPKTIGEITMIQYLARLTPITIEHTFPYDLHD